MDYVTQYYKNLSEQLQQRVNILTRKVKYLTEAEATPGTPPATTPGPKPGGVDPTVDPYTKPDRTWENVPWNPNLPQNPLPPQSPDEWYEENPRPQWQDYDTNGNGDLDPWESEQFRRDLEQWFDAERQIKKNYERWRQQVRDRNRQTPQRGTPTLPYYGA